MRLVAQVDDSANPTVNEYDDADRVTRRIFGDGSVETFTYDDASNLLSSVDPRGVTQSWTYDSLERPTAVSFTNVPSGPNQTTFKAWEYDGLSRPLKAEDNDSIVEYEYSSYSSVLSETQTIGSANRTSSAQSLSGTARTIDRTYDGKGRQTVLSYPHQGTAQYQLAMSYDNLNRVTAISDQATPSSSLNSVVTYKHIGFGSRRLQRISHTSSAVTLNYEYDADQRITRHDAVNASSQRISGFSYAWTRASRRRLERILTNNTNTSETGGDGSVYRYDSAYRLVRHQSGVSSATLNTFTSNNSTPVGSISSANNAEWNIDKVNNWTSHIVDGVSSSFTMAGTNAALNQYSSAAGVNQSYDAMGSLTGAGSEAMKWNAENQLAEYSDGSNTFQYRYDVLGRRIAKIPAEADEIIYFYDGWTVLEEYHRSSSNYLRRFVNGTSIDEPIRVSQTDFGGSVSTPLQLWFHSNSIGSITALTDQSGSVVERYTYKTYGAYDEIKDGSGTTISSSQYDNVYGFTGRRLEVEEDNGLYYYRTRYYSPDKGRFISRDTIGTWGDANNLGNGQAYCGNDPINLTDPMGEDPLMDGLGRNNVYRKVIGDFIEKQQLPDGPMKIEPVLEGAKSTAKQFDKFLSKVKPELEALLGAAEDWAKKPTLPKSKNHNDYPTESELKKVLEMIERIKAGREPGFKLRLAPSGGFWAGKKAKAACIDSILLLEPMIYIYETWIGEVVQGKAHDPYDRMAKKAARAILHELIHRAGVPQEHPTKKINGEEMVEDWAELFTRKIYSHLIHNKGSITPRSVKVSKTKGS